MVMFHANIQVNEVILNTIILKKQTLLFAIIKISSSVQGTLTFYFYFYTPWYYIWVHFLSGLFYLEQHLLQYKSQLAFEFESPLHEVLIYQNYIVKEYAKETKQTFHNKNQNYYYHILNHRENQLRLKIYVLQ